MSKAIAYAVGVLEVNASMGLIVAAPTAGSSGVIPGVFCSLKENYGFSDDEICQALFNAAAIGYLITRNATTAGAEGGCQAEVGSASAMAASAAVEQLNKAYGGGFYLFFRVPVFHAPDQRYMGWERKRGALVELVRLLRGKRTGLRTEAGDSTWLRGVRYVVTLDADTALSVGSAKELAGAMLLSLIHI